MRPTSERSRASWRAAVTAHERQKMKNAKFTITLTDRAPVTIVRAEWPVIASATDRPGSILRGTPVPDYETDEFRLTVRQHADGRSIVYGVIDASTEWTGTEDWRGGELLADGGELVAAITRVGDSMPACVRRDCIADLPAQEI